MTYVTRCFECGTFVPAAKNRCRECREVFCQEHRKHDEDPGDG